MKVARTRNAEATRNAILEAACQHFLQEGYDNAGLRAIAADADSDPALIYRYFGSKKELFAAVLDSASDDPMLTIAGDRDSFGTRMAEAMLSPSRKITRKLLFIRLLTRSSASADAAKLVQQHVMRQFVQPFSQWLGGDKAMEKAWLLASVLVGILVMDNIRGRQTLTVARAATLLQSLIDTP